MIEIVEYDSRWPSQFQAIDRHLTQVLGGLALRIDHIGSTAVPGMCAKDVIDVQVTVEQLDKEVARAFDTMGYPSPLVPFVDHRPPGALGAEEDWQKYFFFQRIGCRNANIHVRVKGRANQRYALLFRDFLRANPEWASVYGELKRRLAIGLTDSSMYASVKDPAVDLIYLAADQWARTTAWIDRL